MVLPLLSHSLRELLALAKKHCPGLSTPSRKRYDWLAVRIVRFCLFCNEAQIPAPGLTSILSLTAAPAFALFANSIAFFLAAWVRTGYTPIPLKFKLAVFLFRLNPSRSNTRFAAFAAFMLPSL